MLWASIQDLLNQSLQDLAIRTSGKLPSLENVNNLHGYFQSQHSLFLICISHPWPSLALGRENTSSQPGLPVWGVKKGLPTEWQCGADSLRGQNQHQAAYR